MAEAAIVAEGPGKRSGPVVALDGVDLELPSGGVLGLLGPNGTGTTTTVRILTTLLRPDAGRARVAGLDVTTPPPSPATAMPPAPDRSHSGRPPSARAEGDHVNLGGQEYDDFS